MIESLVFYVFATVLILSGAMVVLSRNPVQAAMFLVLTFFASAGLWLLLEAEFLALVLVLVYVGAVTTLFLFVVMMIDIDSIPSFREGFVRYLPFGLLALALLVGIMIYVIVPGHFGLAQFPIPAHASADYSNIKELGSVLYTQYAYPFILAGVLLLASIVAAINLCFRGPRHRKHQHIPDQLKVKRADRVKLVNVPSEGKNA